GTRIDVVSQKTNNIVIDKHGNSFEVITLENGETAYLSADVFEGKQVPVRSLDFLKPDGTINWPPAGSDGFVLDEFGNLITEPANLKAG
ncbi:TPA: hypothetical protein TY283_002156, partial [Streptococcus suis]|nr:hypothetical protein [Streptococcus suis]